MRIQKVFHVFHVFSSLCDMADIQNMTNLSSLCGPSVSPLPHSFMFIIQIFYAIICLLGSTPVFYALFLFSAQKDRLNLIWLFRLGWEHPGDICGAALLEDAHCHQLVHPQPGCGGRVLCCWHPLPYHHDVHGSVAIWGHHVQDLLHHHLHQPVFQHSLPFHSSRKMLQNPYMIKCRNLIKCLSVSKFWIQI